MTNTRSVTGVGTLMSPLGSSRPGTEILECQSTDSNKVPWCTTQVHVQDHSLVDLSSKTSW